MGIYNLRLLDIGCLYLQPSGSVRIDNTVLLDLRILFRYWCVYD